MNEVGNSRQQFLVPLNYYQQLNVKKSTKSFRLKIRKKKQGVPL